MAKTNATQTSSKAGLFYELQYDTSSSIHPTLLGAKLLDHRLERSRIASVPTGERSFHALYYLLAGTSPAEKSHLGLEDSSAVGRLEGRIAGQRGSLNDNIQKRWRYLGHPTQLKVGINDAEGFQHFKSALRKLEFPRNDIAEICQILAVILHLGQLEFHTTQSTTPGADDSGGYSHEGGEEVTTVKNRDVLEIIAAFLSLNIQDLDQCLGYKTKTLHRERVTVMLDPKGARDNADELARTLYSLLVAWIMEAINQRICVDEASVSNTVSLVDFPGFNPQAATGSTLDQLLNNAASESLYHFCLHSFFEDKASFLESEDISVPPSSYFDNSETVKGLLKPGNGLLSILDDQMRRGKSDIQFLEAIRKRFEGKNKAIEAGSATTTLPGSQFVTRNMNAAFTVRHWAGEVEYPVEGLLEENSEIVSGDLMNLVNSTKSDFVRGLFGQEAITTVYHPQERTAIMQAQLSSKPSRAPSMARRHGERPNRFGSRRIAGQGPIEDEDTSKPDKKGRSAKLEATVTQGASSEVLSSLDNVVKSISEPSTNPYFVFCLRPNDRRIAQQFDSKCVRSQVQILGIAEISQRLRNADFSVFLPFQEFLGLANTEEMVIGSDREKVESILDEKRWPTNEARAGTTGVFLSERCWMSIAKITEGDVPLPGPFDNETPLERDGEFNQSESKVNLLNPSSGKPGGYFGGRDMDAKSEAGGSMLQGGDMFKNMDTRSEMAEKGNEKVMEEVDVVKRTGARKRWLFFVYLMTWWCPDFLIKGVGRIKRKDVRMAWREKLAINMMIWLACAAVIFFIVGFPYLICPPKKYFSLDDLSIKTGKNGQPSYVALKGVVFDLGKFMPDHQPGFIPQKQLQNYAGKDVTDLFPVQVSGMCQGTDPNVGISPAVQLVDSPLNYQNITTQTTGVDLNAQYHDFRWAYKGPGGWRPDWLTSQMLNLESKYWAGSVVLSQQYINTLTGQGRNLAYINERVYDMTRYIQGGISNQYPPGVTQDTPSNASSKYMDSRINDLFTGNAGKDITRLWNDLDMDAGLRQRMQICMDNLFYVGMLDTRNSTQCLFANYLLLAISILLVAVIGFKFFAALQFGNKTMPEKLDKFIICTIPVYTEDEEALRRSIDSAARMDYDDKRKLIVIVCDGVIIGQGNEKPTPRMVLDILGFHGPDPEMLSFESLGEGMKQHNMGRVYAGLYDSMGHIVPFVVIVKTGKPSEVVKPGNRGKRDSQMILMRFLSRMHYNMPMSPLELEIHHQIRNIIGVNPMFYDFLLQIDADTQVAPDSARRFVSAFLDDTRLIGVCGETALSNAKSSLVTMIQVYEYYISHNLTKAFESLFGSVTCLPGCFTMFRLRAEDTKKPLFICKEIIDDYSEIRVDTLHMKNLLHLGEDRFLTTLLIKHHQKYKTKYIFRAHALTVAPESWKVFLSQRRRWINSTVHNLVELIPMQQLCGFCCFSMRFVVFLDLLSTLVQPVIVGYLVYLIARLAIQARDPNVTDKVPLFSIILLAAIYGLQAIIFILRRKWEMIGWMIIYILAMPVYSFALPLYSFWNMDDFSWGNTRIVTGEGGKQVVVTDEGKYDPNSIPRKRWEEYQSELWEAHTQMDDDSRSAISGYSYGTKAGFAAPRSEISYGTHSPGMMALARQSEAGLPPSRPMSSHLGGGGTPPPRYGSSLSVTGPGYEMSELNSGIAFPTDDQLLAEIRTILAEADLMTVTKKSVKQELERRFGCNLDVKRAYIGSATEAVLSGQL